MRIFPEPKRTKLNREKRIPYTGVNLSFSLGLSGPLKLRIEQFNARYAKPASLTANLSIDPSLAHEQGYRLDIEKRGISIFARCDQGLHYALLTLAQIIGQNPSALPEINIQDWPDLDARGFMLDISRCKVPRLETLFDLIDKISELRYNQLQLYTEHTFAYRDHEIVWRDASPYSAEDIHEIQDHCSQRFIELVPNQNTFGHFERWLRHSDYQHLAECPEGFLHPLTRERRSASTLKPNDASIELIRTLFDELLPNFESSQLNIGGDEPWELGQGWSKPLVEKRGKHAVYIDFLKRTQALARERGKTCQFWGDIVLESPELIASLPSDMLALLWGYEASHPFADQCQKFHDAQVDYYIVPGTSTWNSIGGRLCNALENIDSAIKNGIKYGASGILLTEWGDFGHHHFQVFSYPSIARVALLSWNFNVEKEEVHRSFANTTLLRSEDLRFIEAIEQLGTVHELLEHPLHNESPLNRILFRKPRESAKFVESIALENLMTAKRSLEKTDQLIRSLHANSIQQKEFKDELLFACDLLDYACQKGIDLKDAQPFPSERMALSLESLVARYSKLWLARNREGGLTESIQYLQTANS